jgi:hypothetical protein
MDLWVVKYASRRPGSGIFRAIHRSEAPGSASHASAGQRGCRLREWNRMGSGFGRGSGQLESIEQPRPCSGRARRAGKPRSVRIWSTGGSSMAMNFKVPPHWEQVFHIDV